MHKDRHDPSAKEKDNDKAKTKHQHDPELLEHPSYQEVLKKLDEAENKANDYWERLLRLQAENKNAELRMQKEISSAHKYALEKFINELLPIIDSLELCINNVPEQADETAKAVIEGVNLTLKMFYNAMEKFGIKQVNPVNETFDPEFQQAIQVQYAANTPPGTVVAVLQKGYTLNNRLLRPALVVVAKAEDE
jgi:molecular chaperone GrpE